jgi:hypothetical protein
MPIYASKNQYRGVNAHLNSFIQNVSGEWESSHSAHVAILAFNLDASLPRGYYARIEKALQIREESSEVSHRPRPDISVFARLPVGPVAVAEIATPPTTTMPLVNTVDFAEEEYLNAVVVYQATEEKLLGRVVTRIELLSPTNKPSGRGYWQYRDKRKANLHSGVPLIEIDYLHQSHSVIGNLPSYPDGEKGAFPYTVTVSDPRPSFDQGVSKTYACGVDEPLPTIEVPLAGEDRLPFNLGKVYNETFERTRFYQSVVDYAEKPLAFDTYSPADQEHILKRMAFLAEAVQKGLDLEQGPFPIQAFATTESPPSA